jgi:hypothetical protein
MNLKLIKSVFLLFLGVLLVAVALATVTEPVSAQCNPQQERCCRDPQTGKDVYCPQQPTEEPHKKKTPTPQRRPTKTPTPTATSTPTTVPQPYPYPYPNPYPYPYPGGGSGGGLAPINPPILVCFFCDKPWLWGVLTGVIFVIVAGILIGLLRLPALGGIIGPVDLPGGNENLTATVRNVNGDGELVPAVQRVGEAANNAGNVHIKLDGLDSDAGNSFAKNFDNQAGDAHIKLDGHNPGDAFVKGE